MIRRDHLVGPAGRTTDPIEARRPAGRRAFSLVELLVMIAIIGLISGAAVMRLGDGVFTTVGAEGFVRRMALDMGQARRRAIAVGDDHYLQFSRTSGVVTSYALFQDTGGGAAQVDDTVPVPVGATVTTAGDTWTFDFSGALSAVGASTVIRVDGPNAYWDLTVYHATGSTVIDRVAK